MVRIARSITAGAALAAAMSLTLHPANAATHRRHAQVARMKLVPAHQRPGYVGAPGYAGGPARPGVPTLIEFGDTGRVFGTEILGSGASASGGILGGGGFLGTGVLPSTGIFGNLPVLGGLGL